MVRRFLVVILLAGWLGPLALTLRAARADGAFPDPFDPPPRA